MSPTVRLRVLRAFLVRGERAEVGSTIEIDAAEAADVVSAGRAELVSAKDAPIMRSAHLAQIERALRQAGRPPTWVAR
jgi:hypothetical protein